MREIGIPGNVVKNAFVAGSGHKDLKDKEETGRLIF
jgi:hypothetical protein